MEVSWSRNHNESRLLRCCCMWCIWQFLLFFVRYKFTNKLCAKASIFHFFGFFIFSGIFSFFRQDAELSLESTQSPFLNWILNDVNPKSWEQITKTQTVTQSYFNHSQLQIPYTLFFWNVISVQYILVLVHYRTHILTD